MPATTPNTGGTTADFGNLLIAKTAIDLANTFSSITMEYGTTLGTLRTTAQILALGDFVYPTAAHAQLIGPGLISGFLIALSATDNAQVKAALSGEIQNSALSTKVTKRTVGNTQVDTIKIEVAAGGASVTAYISDFGNFTMMTQYNSVLANTTSFIELIDMKLK